MTLGPLHKSPKKWTPLTVKLLNLNIQKLSLKTGPENMRKNIKIAKNALKA